MFSPRVIGSALALGAGAIGTTKVIMSETHAHTHLITEDEVKNKLFELHGRGQNTYYDVSELASLGEDGNCQGRIGNFQCWGIFDGHAGWSTSNYVSKQIIGYINEALNQKPSKLGWLFPSANSTEGLNDSDKLDRAIADAFIKLDEDILQAPLKAVKNKDAKLAAEALPIAVSGACAMMAFYNPASHLLKVALTGDSRTVLGFQDANGVWHASNLTIDQTGENPSEIARIKAEHPSDPPGFLANGRVLGYQPSRSFGDAVTKYTKDQMALLRKEFWMRTAHPRSISPPYMTAKPVISTVTLDPKRPSFIVLGCDGIYEWLSNEQLVSLVAQWLEKNPVVATKPFKGVEDNSSGYDSATFKRPEHLGWGPLQPVVKDDNVATHLIRNALGGADFKKVSLLMSIPSPMSRRYRDDITCTVVFFTPDESSKL